MNKNKRVDVLDTKYSRTEYPWVPEKTNIPTDSVTGGAVAQLMKTTRLWCEDWIVLRSKNTLLLKKKIHFYWRILDSFV